MLDQVDLVIRLEFINLFKSVFVRDLTNCTIAIRLCLIAILGILHSDHLLIQNSRFNKLISLGFGLSNQQLSSLLFLHYGLFHADTSFDFEIFGVLELEDLGCGLTVVDSEDFLCS